MYSSNKSKKPASGVMRWPYKVNYGAENEIDTDVLIIGGGLSGCFAAISAVNKGARVAIVDKGVLAHSGSAGTGIDHWHGATTNPVSSITPDELAQAIVDFFHGWDCGIARYIECRESYDALLELEKIGVKVRDTKDEFKGAPFRDDETKLLFAYDYVARYCIRIWGTSIKPSLSAECKRLGVKAYERIMVTSLLTEDGKQGTKVVGAVGFHLRTGEFYIFTAKAIILCTASEGRLWVFNSEHRGIFSRAPGYITGDGHAMAWRVGAEFTLFEKSAPCQWGGVIGLNTQPFATGFWNHTWRPCTLVDANGKEVPWVDRDGNILSTIDERNLPALGQKFFIEGGGIIPKVRQADNLVKEYRAPGIIPDLNERINKGEFVLPLYADLPSLPEHERRAIFGLMVGQEGKTWIVYRNLTQGGFDPDKDMLQYYPITVQPRWREFGFNSGGLVYDWDLKTNLEGLFAAGEMLYATLGAAAAATTGRYAGRKAGEFAIKAKETKINRKQVQDEKIRIYAPIKRESGIDWKELNIGIGEVMQDYCSDVRNEESLKIGLKWLEELKEGEASNVFARNPHELARALECLNIITVAEMVMHASLARKASSDWLNFYRSDYPKLDPPEWEKFITLKLVSGEVKTKELPFAFWGSLEENYEAHCGL